MCTVWHASCISQDKGVQSETATHCHRPPLLHGSFRNRTEASPCFSSEAACQPQCTPPFPQTNVRTRCAETFHISAAKDTARLPPSAFSSPDTALKHLPPASGLCCFLQPAKETARCVQRMARWQRTASCRDRSLRRGTICSRTPYRNPVWNMYGLLMWTAWPGVCNNGQAASRE